MKYQRIDPSRLVTHFVGSGSGSVSGHHDLAGLMTNKDSILMTVVILENGLSKPTKQLDTTFESSIARETCNIQRP